jgi:hypothetical protein
VQGQRVIVQVDILDLPVQPGAVAHDAQTAFGSPLECVKRFRVIAFVLFGAPEALEALLETFGRRLLPFRRCGGRIGLGLLATGRQHQHGSEQQHRAHRAPTAILHGGAP